MSGNNALVSIIVPCYNVVDCIEETTMSVINQTDNRFELILVNDGSTDGTEKVLEVLRKRYPIIKIIDKSNGGVSSARNAGLKLATAPYVYFLDGDDYIVPTFIEEIGNAVEGQDVVVFGSLQEKEKGKFCHHPNNYAEDYLYAYLKGKICIHNSSYVLSLALVNKYDLHFDEKTYYSEDREFIVKCLLYAESVISIPRILFHYKWRKGSAMHKPQFTSKKLTSLYAMKRVYELLKFSKVYRGIALVQLQLTILLNMRLFLHQKCEHMDLWNELVENWKKSNHNPHVYLGRYAMFVQAMRFFYAVSPRLMYFVLK